MRVQLFLGPPGTGKTTRLMRVLEEALQSGTLAHEIAYCSYTNAAVDEALLRAAIVFGLRKRSAKKLDRDARAKLKESLPWFGTIHSLCLSNSRYSAKNLLTAEDFAAISDLVGGEFRLVPKRDDAELHLMLEDQNFHGHLKLGDAMLSMYNLCKARDIDVERVFETDATSIGFSLDRYKRFEAAYTDYKRLNDKIDFSDMLRTGRQFGSIPNVKLAIVDEAQDLTHAQWEAVDVLFANVDTLCVAGDDDQAIYRWSGADVDRFLALAKTSEVEVLDHSYRLPRRVFALAQVVANEIQERLPKAWGPRDEEGEVHLHTSFENIDMSQGTWLVLARNNYLFKRVKKHLSMLGYLYMSKRSKSADVTHLTGIHAWQALQKNESITYGEACALYDCLIDSPTNGVKHGNKKKLVAAIDIDYFDHDYLRHYFGLHVDLKNEWYDALLKIPAEIRANYTQMQINKELELDEPRIVLDTFHGAKGTEAENVIVLTDMATQTFELYEKNRDDELRALYVAVTRAKRSLHLITPRQSTAYKDIERMYHDALALPSERALESETRYAETI